MRAGASREQAVVCVVEREGQHRQGGAGGRDGEGDAEGDGEVAGEVEAEMLRETETGRGRQGGGTGSDL